MKYFSQSVLFKNTISFGRSLGHVGLLPSIGGGVVESVESVDSSAVVASSVVSSSVVDSSVVSSGIEVRSGFKQSLSSSSTQAPNCVLQNWPSHDPRDPTSFSQYKKLVQSSGLKYFEIYQDVLRLHWNTLIDKFLLCNDVSWRFLRVTSEANFLIQ